MPPHSFHAQMAARFFGCALIIVPLAGDICLFAHEWTLTDKITPGDRHGRAMCVISPWDRLCVDAPLWSHENVITFLISIVSCRNLAWRCHEVLGHIRQSMSRSRKDHQYNSNEGRLKKVQGTMKFLLELFRQNPHYSAKTIRVLPVIKIIWAKFCERTYCFRFRAFLLRTNLYWRKSSGILISFSLTIFSKWLLNGSAVHSSSRILSLRVYGNGSSENSSTIFFTNIASISKYDRWLM